jgi:DMSO/TMAO reductase YedYZ molybdopterin-dependent catalytic subunit
MRRNISLALGALVGSLLTAPLLALIFVGQQLAGLPFLPSDFFNPVRDLTPGAVIVTVIQAMVDVILALNLGRVDQVAKIVETWMAVGMVFVIGVISGAVFFYALNRVDRSQWRLAGIAGGLLVGIPMALISYFLGVTSTVDPRILGSIWLVGLFLVWGAAHVWAYSRLTDHDETRAASRTSDLQVQSAERRQFLITIGAASATITVLGAGLGSLLRRTDAASVASAQTGDSGASLASVIVPSPPNASDPLVPAPGTRPAITPVSEHYRIDISTIPPRLDEASWTLPFVSSIEGSEQILAEFTLEQIKAYEPIGDYITMSCISNRIAGDLISTTYWTGVSFKRLLEDVPLPPSATHLKLYAADGFDETVALDIIRGDERVMLAYYWEGKPLTTEHGFPLRIHIPDLYGMKQPKWITRIEVLTSDQEGYWVRRGWDRIARVRATSVIDTVAVDDIYTQDDQQFVPVGGIAWAGARGISKVEVRVDNGDWQAARLRAPASDRAWVLWRYEWPFSEGRHTFEVRCVEADGTPQIETEEGVRPSGATGIHSSEARL